MKFEELEVGKEYIHKKSGSRFLILHKGNKKAFCRIERKSGGYETLISEVTIKHLFPVPQKYYVNYYKRESGNFFGHIRETKKSCNQEMTFNGYENLFVKTIEIEV